MTSSSGSGSETVSLTRRPLGQIPLSLQDGSISRANYQRGSPLRNPSSWDLMIKGEERQGSCSPCSSPRGVGVGVNMMMMKRIKIASSTPPPTLASTRDTSSPGSDAHNNKIPKRGSASSSSSSSNATNGSPLRASHRHSLRSRPSMIGDMMLMKRSVALPAVSTPPPTPVRPAIVPVQQGAATQRSRSSQNLLHTVLVEEPSSYNEHTRYASEDGAVDDPRRRRGARPKMHKASSSKAYASTSTSTPSSPFTIESPGKRPPAIPTSSSASSLLLPSTAAASSPSSASASPVATTAAVRRRTATHHRQSTQSPSKTSSSVTAAEFVIYEDPPESFIAEKYASGSSPLQLEDDEDTENIPPPTCTSYSGANTYNFNAWSNENKSIPRPSSSSLIASSPSNAQAYPAPTSMNPTTASAAGAFPSTSIPQTTRTASTSLHLADVTVTAATPIL